ncbi:disease resistance protein RUN1-like [Eucalyptus grandis]|uniref:disease resistance protein RUN1-like n=1 Tax=Eucalyptus grandis TaxID=71139 RepID=UPI00192EC563|nr:disease resistance protein RUN1-like [Eucalyptus grandis]XP_039164383.1 disease resistance protein RUN1-like [Eucalyptus grandis]XP_039164384.1 disease resistance protein RUN1-like [Eucalyptus grandis]
MGKHRSKQRRMRVRDTDASSLTISKRPRPDVPSASGANSDPPASSTSVNGNNYHVFLSFRGPDTRKGFVDHLYQRLKALGPRYHPNSVFRDDEDLPFGEKIGENLISAIERSKVSIPVISENYAASEWCLRELIHIMECKESRGQKVLPVLYKVKPKHVRKLKGAFGKAYKSCKDKFEKEVEQQGLLALRKAVDLRVFESEKFADGHEGELVNKLVEIILREEQHDLPPDLPENLVAIEDRVAEVMELVDLARPDTRIIGIWGMGGIGKTTLATIIYKKLFDKFQCHSSLQDIREEINCKGVEHVQSLLISEITKSPPHSVPKSAIGIARIQSSCENKKVLILLDDVDHRDHLDKLIGGCNFGSGSRIIITCRDKTLFKSDYEIYELKEMNSEQSLLLFSRYAFEAEQPPKDLVTLSSAIVATTGGLPLALMVVGSLLKGEKDQMIWKERLEKLRKVPHVDVQKKLKISYDSLGHAEKEMFLDIACFLIGTDKRIATYFWADLKFFPLTGLQILINRSLIKIEDKNKLRMHDQLRDLGRAIAHPAYKKPWDCSRLWDKEEVMEVLRRKVDSENIEALRLDQRGSREFIRREGFKKMPNLKFLHVKDVNFDGDLKESLTKLRWLKWEGCCDSFKPTNFRLEKLVILDLSLDYSYHSQNSISENWSGWSSIKMKKLKFLILSGCTGLKRNPDLCVFKNLEELILEGCNNLKKIDPSIGALKQLKRLNAHGCLQLTDISPSIGKLGELVVLNLSRTSITGLPESIGELNKLEILWLHLSKIKMLPSSIGKLQRLKELDASECYHLKGQIRVDKGGLFSLKTLRLGWSRKISGLPENLDQLSSLKHLDLRGCEKLRSFPKPPCNLKSLWLTCRSNELPSLSHLNHLQELYLSSCESLQSIPELPSCIPKLRICRCPKLERLPKLSDLEFLLELQVRECGGLKKLDGLETLKSLRRLDLDSSILNYCDGNADKLHPIRDLEKSGSLKVGLIFGAASVRVYRLLSG